MTKKRANSKQRAFLAAFRLTASITKAAAAAEIERTVHYRWIRDNAGYAHAFELAKEEAAQTLEDEAIRRAHEGVLTPVFYQGKPAGVVREYSDGLMQFLLKGFRPEKYRERSNVEVSAPGGGPIAVTNEGLAKLTDDELASLIALASKLTPGDEK